MCYCLSFSDATTSQFHKSTEGLIGTMEQPGTKNVASVILDNNSELRENVADLNLEEREVVLHTAGEPNCMHIIAEWPPTNADFQLLTKMDDERAASDNFLTGKEASDDFNLEDWFIRPDLSDEDIPPGRRLRMNPGRKYSAAH